MMNTGSITKTTPHVYPLSMRVFHWGMAALLLSLLFAGLAMVQSLQTWQPTVLALHKAFGVIALIAVLARLINRLRHNTLPALPSDLPSWQQFAARASHVLLYAAMIAMPVSGYLMQSAAGRSVSMFGWFSLPPLMDANLIAYAVFREFHGWVAMALIALIVVHIGAALHHGLVRKDGVLKSMLK